MSRDVIISIDAGTTVIKAVAFTLDGQQIGMAGLPNHYTNTADGKAEQDMLQTWKTVVDVLQTLIGSIPNLATRVAALAVTAQGDGTWLIDENGTPTAPALLWLDSRARDIVQEVVTRETYPEIFSINGTGTNSCQQSAQLAWFKRNRPDILARSATALHCKDWLYFKLTDVRTTDASEGTFTFGDFRTRQYDRALLEAFDIADLAPLLPPIMDGVKQSHRLSAKAAQETGLEEGIPVVLGYIDVVCSSLGGGLFDPEGRAGCSVLGSTGVHMRLALTPDDVRLNGECSGYTIPFPHEKACIQMQSNMAAAINIDWIVDVARDVLATRGIRPSRSEFLESADEIIREQSSGGLLYHPYISPSGERGPFMEPFARAGFIGIDSSNGFFTMMRAVYEGLAFAARDCYSAMGPLPSEVILTGGAARSKALRSILGDVLGAKIRCSQREETGAAGAAMIAAVQIGRYADLKTCSEEWVAPYLGDPETTNSIPADHFTSLFHAYQTSREALRPVWKDMAASAKGAPQ
ncbi:FGGY-family carbohydrate kinase [uncultured Cohaesibacter sp.]|uniref:FGGY-family carbohydrate kinase n=1 Tax=uncultured Cohaesibacter sp. TaxID=1002546 RepID=UPI0029310CC6|nr:FGGY-family carbohydrate kinase [uncultured Cohaesibacter sp.]